VTTAVDSSVILDVLTDDAAFATRSSQALRQASRQGQLIVCESVLAEVFPVLGSRARVKQFLADWQFDFLPSDLESALLAGEMFLAFKQRNREGKRILADFFVGAHAMVHADRLLARDRGYLRDYFKDLKTIDPMA
jgi:predicted nucleic acid-binding protein